MKLLAVDTSAAGCGVAVVDDALLIAETVLVRRQTHSKHLMELVRNALASAGLTAREMDAFAVVEGPGSFTGLRIGVSAVKGMADACGKPAAGVSSLRALAHQLPFSPLPLCVLMDARRGEVYCARFRAAEGILKRETADRVMTPEAAVAEITAPHLFLGNGAALHRSLIEDRLGARACFAPARFNVLRAAAAAELGMAKIREAGNDALLSPRYIRLSDAEINLKKKKNASVR